MTITEKLLVILAITILAIAFSVTRRYWQPLLLQYWQPLLFSFLCILVPAAFQCSAQLYDEYGDLQRHSATVGCLIFGGLASCSLLVWSVWDFRHHKVRAVIGFVVCSVTFLWTFLYLRSIEFSKS
jgi:hypothetical protein